MAAELNPTQLFKCNIRWIDLVVKQTEKLIQQILLNSATRKHILSKSVRDSELDLFCKNLIIFGLRSVTNETEYKKLMNKIGKHIKVLCKYLFHIFFI